LHEQAAGCEIGKVVWHRIGKIVTYRSGNLPVPWQPPMEIMIATRPTLPVLVRFGLALTPLIVPCPLSHGADESADRRPADVSGTAAPVLRRSHIQPVGEVAAATRHSDTLGMRLARASEVLRQQLALARGAGLVVEEVAPGSVAEKAGFRQHDVLVLLDDQMLLLPEQLTALLDASQGVSSPECTLLRGGVKVTIPLGQPARLPQTVQAAPVRATGPDVIPGGPKAAAAATAPAIRQTAAKQPSTAPRLRAPASTLALVQPSLADQAGQAVQTSASTPTAPNTASAPANQTLVRQDPDYQIKLTRGDETRLVVLDPRGRIVFNDEIDTPEHRSLVPPPIRERVAEMERSLEPAPRAAAEIGRLEVAPIELR